jgi:hypothetical protein
VTSTRLLSFARAVRIINAMAVRTPGLAILSLASIVAYGVILLAMGGRGGNGGRRARVPELPPPEPSPRPGVRRRRTA